MPTDAQKVCLKIVDMENEPQISFWCHFCIILIILMAEYAIQSLFWIISISMTMCLGCVIATKVMPACWEIYWYPMFEKKDTSALWIRTVSLMANEIYACTMGESWWLVLCWKSIIPASCAPSERPLPLRPPHEFSNSPLYELACPTLHSAVHSLSLSCFQTCIQCL